MTDRIDNTDASDALAASTVRALLLAQIELDETVYVHSGVGDFVWNGNTFSGVGDLGKVSAAEETEDPQANSISMQLSGVNSAYVSASLGEHYQGNPAKLWIAFLDTNYELVGAPVMYFAGRIDTTDIELGSTATITATVQSRLVDWNRPRIERYTDQEQQALYPADRGLGYVSRTVAQQLVWGQT